MAFVNIKRKEVHLKIVYYGPGRCGKTTNLEYIYEKCKKQIGSEMVAIKTQGDRTLFFDYLPMDVGTVRGFTIKVRLYTVPGQVIYNETRRLVLKGVDGVVFVADSLKVRNEKNRASLKNLQENLAAYRKSIFKIPMVMQYNKRDLEGCGIPLSPVNVLERCLNRRLQRPFFTASALKGDNVLPTLKKIITATVESLSDELS
ncbi:MAG: GTPase domain-containing protein [Deltaproteobacteria bacterium]|nr:GTPase domain-containing protein [Deltaproteobacteria bacterium]